MMLERIHGRYFGDFRTGIWFWFDQLPLNYDNSIYPDNERVRISGWRNGVPEIETQAFDEQGRGLGWQSVKKQ